jgi:hypothetical protein
MFSFSHHNSSFKKSNREYVSVPCPLLITKSLICGAQLASFPFNYFTVIQPHKNYHPLPFLGLALNTRYTCNVNGNIKTIQSCFMKNLLRNEYFWIASVQLFVQPQFIFLKNKGLALFYIELLRLFHRNTYI